VWVGVDKIWIPAALAATTHRHHLLFLMMASLFDAGRKAVIRGACAAFLVLLPAAAALAQGAALPDPRQPGLPPSERLGALLDRMQLEQAAVETLEADFVQLKESQFLMAPAESAGQFSYSAPDRVRWEHRSPTPISLLITGDEMVTWYRDLEKVERMLVGRHSQRILEYLGATGSVEQLRKYFSVRLELNSDRSQPYQLELTPRYSRIAKRLQRMVVWVDPELFLLSRLRLVEPDGDLTEYRFNRLRVNGGLPPERFDLDLPTGIVVETVDFEARLGIRQ
jgi:outer membrane lipoprotein-sorting protein